MKSYFRQLTLCIGLLLGSLLAPAQAEPVEIDRIVAVVNDEAITRTELDAEITTITLQLRQQQAPVPPADILEKQVLERLILKHLQLQLAKSNNIVVDEDTLNKALNRIAEQNHLTLAEFRDILQKDGYPFNKFREDIRTEIITTRLRQRFVDNRISISESDVDEFLAKQRASAKAGDEYRLGHILVSVPEAASPEEIQKAKDKANELLDKLHNGADFLELAVAESNAQEALSGGDLGWRKAGQLPTLFSNLVPKMKVGDISNLIRSPSGFHIIKLLEHRGGKRHVVTQTHARHILIKTNEVTTDADARHKLEQLRSRIEDGADFSELAKAHSDDKGSAANGGDLGWAAPGVMVPAFEAQMAKLQPGEISQPFQTQFGWHIVQVLGRRDYDDTEEFRRNNARRQLTESKVTEEQELWLHRLREEAYVDIRLDD